MSDIIGDDGDDLDGIRRRATAGALKLGLRNVLVRSVGLIGTIVLARLLKPADFGLVALGLSLQLIGNVLTSGGLGAELVRREEPPTEHELRCVLGYQLLAAFVLAGLATVAALAVGHDAIFIALISFSIPVAVLNTPSRILLSRALNWDLIAYSEIAGTMVFNTMAIVLVVAGVGVYGVAIGTIGEAFTVVALLIAFGPVGLPGPKFSFSTIRPMLAFGLAYQSMSLVDRGRDQGVNILVAAIGGLTMLGIWTAAYRIFLSINLVLEALLQVSFPAMSRMLEVGHDAHRMVDNVLRLNATAFGFPAVAVAGSAPALVPILFGSAFSSGISVLPWGAASLLLTGPIVTAGLSFIQAKGDSRGMIQSYLIQTAVWLSLGCALIPIFGVEGVGMAMFIAAFSLVFALKRRTQRYVRMDFFSVIWAPAIAAAIGASLGWLVASTLDPQGLALIASLAVSELVYLLVLLVLRRGDVLTLLSTIRGAARTAFPAMPRISASSARGAST